jgi:hypothetical protein
MEDITGYKVFHIPSKKIIKIKKDFLNGELLFDDNTIGRDDDVIVMEELTIYIQTHQELINEFNSLLEDDKDFNYNKNEFINWFFDYYYV